MSPARQVTRSPRRGRIGPQSRASLTVQTKHKAKSANVTRKKKRDFDPQAFLATMGDGRDFVHFPKKRTIFVQGDTSDTVFYVQTGKVKLSVVSKTGKEATIRNPR